MFLRFQTRMGAITQDQEYEMLKRAWRVFEALGEKHSRIIEGQRPTLKFLAVLQELFLPRADLCGVGKHGRRTPHRRGIPGVGRNRTRPEMLNLWGGQTKAAFTSCPKRPCRVVNEAIRRQGDFLSLGRNDLLAALAREGFIEPAKDEEHPA